jgi:hypothetical protein
MDQGTPSNKPSMPQKLSSSEFERGGWLRGGSGGRVRVAYIREEVGEGERSGGPEKGVRVDDHHHEADVICTRRRVHEGLC